MSTTSPPLSLRLPEKARLRLDRVATRTRRSRSYILQRALEKYLDALEAEEAAPGAERDLSTLLFLGGAGVAETGPRSPEAIDAHIRWLRDNG